MEDKEMQQLIEKALQKALGFDPKGLQTSVNEIKAWGAENGRLKEAENAIKQVEETVRGVSANIEQKLMATARRAYNQQGSYRGAFASEDQAREFALNACRLSAGSDHQDAAKRAVQILSTDHKEFFDRVKDLTGEESVMPHEHSTRIHRLVEDYGNFPRRAFHMPMAGDTLSFTRRISGFRARKSKVRAKIGKQNMQVAPVNLTADSFDILTSWPKKIDDDAFVSLAELFAVEMGLGFAVALDEDGYIGDGSDAFDNEEGIVFKLKNINGVDDGGGLVLSSGGASSGWSGVTKDDVLSMIGRARYVRPGQARLEGSSEFFWTVLAKIITDAGGRTMMESQQGLQLNFFGVPYDINHVMPRTTGNSQVPLIYGDTFQSSTLGDRQQLSIDTSKDVYFESKEIGMLGSARYAIQNHSLGDDVTPGPVVGLITPVA